MSQLLLDIGNTRIKWAVREAGSIGTPQALSHGDPAWLAGFDAALALMPEPAEVLIAAVAPELLTLDALRVLEARWPRCPSMRAQSAARLARFSSAYAQPERLGVDRFLACAAAAESLQPLLLLGCGTALTIDLIDADGRHHGGLIAPAPETMRAAVLSRTARVHWLRAGAAQDFGSNTEDCLESGVWTAAAGMVERALRKGTAVLGAVPVLMAHGGAAAALASLLDVPLRIVPDLVMQGLALWADQRAS